jgi:putative oxidoreductase
LSAAGAAIILGIKPKLAAAAIGSFLGLSSPIFHDFWNEEDAGSAQNQMIHFSKNMALLGAALVMVGSAERWPLCIAE